MNRDTLRQAAVVGAALTGIVAGATGDYGSATQSASLVIPADYAFAIWGPIYLGALAYAGYQALPSVSDDPVLRRVGWPAALALFTVGLWSRVAEFEQLWANEALIATTLAAAAIAYGRLRPGAVALDREQAWLVRVPLGLFAGWITLATAAGTTEALLTAGVTRLGFGATPWAVAVLLVAGGVATAVTLRTRGTLAYPVAVAWGLAGAAVQQLPTAPLPGLTAAVMAVLVAAAGVFTLPPVRNWFPNLRRRPAVS